MQSEEQWWLARVHAESRIERPDGTEVVAGYFCTRAVRAKTPEDAWTAIQLELADAPSVSAFCRTKDVPRPLATCEWIRPIDASRARSKKFSGFTFYFAGDGDSNAEEGDEPALDEVRTSRGPLDLARRAWKWLRERALRDS